MGHCPSAVLEALADHAPASLETLIPAASFDRVRELAQPMPAVCGGGGFDCDLAAEAPVDFTLEVGHDDADGLRALASEDGALRATLDRWLWPESLVHAMVEQVALTFDLAERTEHGDRATTGCFPWLAVRHAFSRNGRDEIASPAWLGTLCAEIGGGTRASRATHRVARCVAALPDGAQVQQVGAVARAGADPLRLQAVLRTPALSSWLEQIGWRGDEVVVREAIAIACESGFTHLAAAIDVGAEVGTSLSIELACDDRQVLSSRWDDLLRGLVDRGLAAGERAAAVRRWWGRMPCRVGGSPWRVDLQRQFHVKLVVLDDSPGLAARASLSFEPRYVLV